MGKQTTKQAIPRKRWASPRLAPSTDCPVLRLARLAEQIRMAVGDDHFFKQEEPEQEDRLNRRAERLEARYESLVLESSYQLAMSPEGAAFHLMVASGTYDLATSSTYTAKWQKHRDVMMAERCAYSALRFLESLATEELPAIREFYMAAGMDQHDLLPLDVLSRPEETEQPAAATAG